MKEKEENKECFIPFEKIKDVNIDAVDKNESYIKNPSNKTLQEKEESNTAQLNTEKKNEREIAENNLRSSLKNTAEKLILTKMYEDLDSRTLELINEILCVLINEKIGMIQNVLLIIANLIVLADFEKNILDEESLKNLISAMATICKINQEWMILNKIEFVAKRLQINVDCDEKLMNFLKQKLNQIEIIKVWKSDSFCLRKIVDAANKINEYSEKNRTEYLNSVKRRRIDKALIDYRNSLILGDNGGLYLLLNSLNSEDDCTLLLESGKFSEEFIASLKDKNNKGKLLIGKGDLGKCRLAISIFGNEKVDFGEIVCVKKTNHFGFLDEKKENAEQMNFRKILSEYMQTQTLKEFYTPKFLDMALVLNQSDEKKNKGYLIMEIFPDNNAETIFCYNSRFCKWDYQKPYILGLLNHINTLWGKNLFIPDLKPENTLFNVVSRKTYLVDTGSIILFDPSKAKNYSFDSKFIYSIDYCPPEYLKGDLDNFNLYYWSSYSCAKVIKSVTRGNKEDLDQKDIDELEKIIKLMINQEINLDQAIKEIASIKQDISWKEVAFVDSLKKYIFEKREADKLGLFVFDKDESLLTLKGIKIGGFEVNEKKKTSGKQAKNEDIGINLENKIDHFLETDSKSLLIILGQAGSGKSTLLQSKFYDEVWRWKKDKPIPFYMNCANGLDLLEHLNKFNNLFDTDLKIGKRSAPFHFFIDSLNECLDFSYLKGLLLDPLFKLSKKSKVVIACRAENHINDFKIEMSTPNLKSLLSQDQECNPYIKNFFDIPEKYSNTFLKYVVENDIAAEMIKILPLEYNSDLETEIKNKLLFNVKSDEIKEKIVKKLRSLNFTDYLNTAMMCKSIINVLKEDLTVWNSLEEDFSKANSKFYTLFDCLLKKEIESKLKLMEGKKKDRLKEFSIKHEISPDGDLTETIIYIGISIAFLMDKNQKNIVRFKQLSSHLSKNKGSDRASELLYSNTDLYQLLMLLPLKFKKEEPEVLIISFIHENFKKFFFHAGSRKRLVETNRVLDYFWRDFKKSYKNEKNTFYEFFTALGIESYPEGRYKYLHFLEGVDKIAIYSKDSLDHSIYVREDVYLSYSGKTYIEVAEKIEFLLEPYYKICIESHEFKSLFSKIYLAKLEEKSSLLYFKEYLINRRAVFSFHVIREVKNVKGSGLSPLQEDYLLFKYESYKARSQKLNLETVDPFINSEETFLSSKFNFFAIPFFINFLTNS